ncbi:unnamed protein product [Penicillium salamii]|uniref:Zn(2)-C6 fungal-type domain-containing protein n=1 Tax=Penicillium salamii TaxID=1612424 RepID=A0A9W4JBG8_9EURO|nr:unnamed protein product [Penicillium salamii]CAG7977057.1 unnamed protein product [Penicillium salamii]CAG8035124.1 unnamed protein product [Penicillium salamii]CAG8056719.1 unnamed protein product [Penicillium salamii]CAG8142499.1 unnamed protein product [Penicillium salamii]
MTEASSTQRRTTRTVGRQRACDTCFKRKIKCDAEFPQCNWCKHHGLACTYNRIAGRIKSRNQIDLSSVGRSIQSNSTGSSVPDFDASLYSSFGQPHGTARFASQFRSVTALSGIDLLSAEGFRWIEAQVGEKIEEAKLNTFDLPWTCPRRLQEDNAITAGSVTELPRRQVVELYVRRYVSSFQTLVFPVISKSLFVQTLDLAYGPPELFGYASARACVWSFLSLVTLFGLDTNVSGTVDCGFSILEAQKLLPRLIQEMTVDGIQSLLMLLQLQYFLGDLQSAAVSISIATRLLYKLGAHMAPKHMGLSDHTFHYDKRMLVFHLRDLFWLCYSFDKDISLRTGQPPSINDSDCDLSLPLEYARLQNINIKRHYLTPDDHVIPLFPWDLRLSKIKSEAFSDLYSARSHTRSNSEVLGSIRHLDEALEEWRLSLDPDIRPMLWHTPETSIRISMNTQEVILRLAYYHCVSIIHQASDRRDNTDFRTGVKSRFINSSDEISTTASRSTLALIDATLPSLKGECFWVLLFYILTATLTLFCNILKDPSNQKSSDDVNVLYAVPSLLNNIPIRNLTPAEIIHLKFLNGFTAELARLGHCAISKAQGRLGGT